MYVCKQKGVPTHNAGKRADDACLQLAALKNNLWHVTSGNISPVTILRKCILVKFAKAFHFPALNVTAASLCLFNATLCGIEATLLCNLYVHKDKTYGASCGVLVPALRKLQ